MATTDTTLNNFNQTMVGNTQNTGVANTSTPGVFTGASSVNFLGTPAQTTNNAPTIVSNYNTAGKVNETKDKFNNLAVPYQPKQPQVNQDGEIINPTPEDVNTFNSQYETYKPEKSYYTPEAEYAMKGFDTLKTESDDITKQYLQQTQDKYKQLQEDQKIANSQAQNNALLAMGIQGGSGSPTDRNSYVQSVIDQGQRKLQALNLEERGVYLEALKAQKDENYKLFSDKVKQLDVVRNAKIEEAKTFNQKLQEQAEKVKEEALTAQKEQAVADIVSKGVTDPMEIVSQLRAQGKNVPLKTVTDTVGLMTGLGGTGIIAEYNYYKAEAKKAGITPVDFATYQNEDANRKAVATGLSGTGTTGITYSPVQSKYIDSVNEKVSKNTTYQTTNKMKTFIQNVLTALNQENGIADIAAINQFQKIIDEGAVTRDQDVVLLQGAQSLVNTLGLKVENLRKGDKLGDGQRQQMKDLINEIYSAQTQALESDPYISTVKQALKRNGIAEEDTIIGELGGFSNATTDSLLNVEKNAEADFASLKNNPPEVQKEITNRYNDLQTILGRPPTASEYFEANPWDKPKKSASVSTTTDPSKGIVGGINLKGYATDPNHIKAVATIYNQVPEPTSTLDFDKYIKSVAPKSKITGEDILEASGAFQLDPKAMLALMQHESRVGTSSVALANNNYGGITWSPSYAKNNPGAMKGTPRPSNEGGYYVKFATPLDGLMAQAKLLSNRKIA